MLIAVNTVKGWEPRPIWGPFAALGFSIPPPLSAPSGLPFRVQTWDNGICLG